MKKSQLQTVKDQLREKGEISRNWCLERYISRLAPLILNLKDKGWKFTTEERQGDYIYKLIKDPSKFDNNVYKEEVIKQREQEYLNPTLF